MKCAKCGGVLEGTPRVTNHGTTIGKGGKSSRNWKVGWHGRCFAGEEIAMLNALNGDRAHHPIVLSKIEARGPGRVEWGEERSEDHG